MHNARRLCKITIKITNKSIKMAELSQIMINFVTLQIKPEEMKRLTLTLFALLTLIVGGVQSISAEDVEMKYVNALDLRIINKGFNDTTSPYTRLPVWLQDSVRPTLWERSQCRSGMAVRFATDSKKVAVRYNLLWNTHMVHMADTGLKGVDLYRLSDSGEWEYVNTCRPYKSDSIQTKVFVENLKGDMREFMIYLPLYDGGNWLEVGVEQTATITKPNIDNPTTGKQVIFYGTSILQGGCSTRTGMCGTNIIQRDLGLECVNIGISGEGKMDFCMARAMAGIKDAVAFVIDPVPNCTEMMCDTLTYDFIKILRTMRPEVPVIMVEGPLYPYAKFDSFFGNYLPKKNAAFYKNYLRLKAEDASNLYYVNCDNLYGGQEGTVDGVHATDIGFLAYAKKLEPVIMQALLHSNDAKAAKHIEKCEQKPECKAKKKSKKK